MKILVINCGSSSLKYQLMNMTNEEVLASGICERIAIDGSRIKHTPHHSEKVVIDTDIPDHDKAIELVMDALVSKEHGVIDSMDEIQAIGHRIVHGGEQFKESIIITDEVIRGIEEVSDLAPLHNPANLMGIRAAQKIMPGKPNVAVFDTAFHQTMPAYAYLYALPYDYYRKYKVRRYGFHGTSHRYVAKRTAELLGKDVKELKTIICHLGNGASVCAVKYGQSVDTSMGLTPLEGLMMGTRSGDIDPAIIEYLCEKENMSVAEITHILNKKSGALGISEMSSDFRDLEDAIAEGHAQARLTMDVFGYRVAKYIGAYAAAMNGVDAVVFTAGLGENNGELREEICAYLDYLGVKIDKQLNACRSTERDFTGEGSKVKTLVIPTNEELMIARDTLELLKD